MSVSREDTRLADAEEVDKVALGDGEEERAEPDILRLGNPQPLVAVVNVEDARDDQVLGNGIQRRPRVRDCGDVGGSCHVENSCR
jgi:hypothetical protein